jgi:hypothetical protein
VIRAGGHIGGVVVAAIAMSAVALGSWLPAQARGDVPRTQAPSVAQLRFDGTVPSQPSPAVATATSSNWAGYVVGQPVDGQTTYTSVTGTWRMPRVRCTQATAGAASAVWVGLGGSSESSPALEQIGTSSDCSRAAKPDYYAWYEIVPAPPVPVTLKVVPGDTITTSVNVDGTTVLLQIKNRTRRTSFTTRVNVDSPDLSSAEWIAEAPSLCTSTNSCRPVALANFGTVSFSRAAAIGSGHPGTISDAAFGATMVQLVPDAGQGQWGGMASLAPTSAAGATPSPLTTDGRAFTVTWQENASAIG